MRLSESLRRNIIEARVGSVINNFKLLKRRNVFFFEELEAQYILECEKNAYQQQLMKIGQEWMFLVFKTLVPPVAKTISPQFFLNRIMKTVWSSLGLVDRFEMEKTKEEIRIMVRNEAITRYIGRNAFTVGCYSGILGAFFGLKSEALKTIQRKHRSEYLYVLTDVPFNDIRSRSRNNYLKLNDVKYIKGYTIRDALKNNIFVLSDNKVFFRKKLISPVESTIFTIIGDYGLLQEKFAPISYKFFSQILKDGLSINEKLSLLKTLFQIMGWGIINIILKDKNIIIDLTNPPYGLKRKDNWNYVALTFLGYLQHAIENLRLKGISSMPNTISFKYSSD